MKRVMPVLLLLLMAGCASRPLQLPATPVHSQAPAPPAPVQTTSDVTSDPLVPYQSDALGVRLSYPEGFEKPEVTEQGVPTLTLRFATGDITISRAARAPGKTLQDLATEQIAANSKASSGRIKATDIGKQQPVGGAEAWGVQSYFDSAAARTDSLTVIVLAGAFQYGITCSTKQGPPVIPWENVQPMCQRLLHTITFTGQPAPRQGSINLNGDVYTVPLPTGADDWVRAVATAKGIVWEGPQPHTGEGLERHATAPLTLYLSPFQKGGGDLSHGAQALLTFPLTVPYQSTQAYLSGFQMADAGDWAALLLSLRVPNQNQGPFRLDAVNVKTREHRIITDAWLTGGMYFTWRAEPGRIFWEQRDVGPTELLASKMIDLETGKVSDVAPGTAQKK